MNPITILELRGNITFQTVQINREINKGFFSLLRIISIICNYGSNGMKTFFVSRSGAVGRGAEHKLCYG